MTYEEKERILNWIRRVATSGSFERFDDLHLDEIKSTLERSNWLDKGLEYLYFAANVRDSDKIPFTVALGISLISSAKERGINFVSKEQMEKEMDDTPPSLYLFHNTQTNWAATPKEKVNLSLFKLLNSANCYYSEYKEEEESEYRRSLWIVV